MFIVRGHRNNETFIYSRVPFEHQAQTDAKACVRNTGKAASITGIGNDDGFLEIWRWDEALGLAVRCYRVSKVAAKG
jgi:hypothetical protein